MLSESIFGRCMHEHKIAPLILFAVLLRQEMKDYTVSHGCLPPFYSLAALWLVQLDGMIW